MNIKSEYQILLIMEQLNLQEFLEKHNDTSYFIGHPDLNWTLEEKKTAVNLCIKLAHDQAEKSMDALRILCREKEGCEELSSNKVYCSDIDNYRIFSFLF